MKMNLHFVILFISARITSGAVLPSTNSSEQVDIKEMYSSKPDEIWPIQPILLYPSARQVPHHGRAFFKDNIINSPTQPLFLNSSARQNPYQDKDFWKDNKIIYIKLSKRKGYRPKKVKIQMDKMHYPKEVHMKDIFYVKALANGQFSEHRLKLYRLPEFYAITVYKKGQLKQ